MEKSPEIIRSGISKFCEVLLERPDISEWAMYKSLPSHPFDLPQHFTPSWSKRSCFYQVFPGSTKTACYGLIAHMQKCLIGCKTESAFQLRIIRVEMARDWYNTCRFIHDLYFEFESAGGVYIAGDCNDYSGTGGAGGRNLEEIFQTISNIYQVQVEEVVIPLEQGRHFKKRMTEWALKRNSAA